MDRRRISCGTDWESRVGYSRAIRVGDRVLVSGTVAVDEDGEPVAPGDPGTQTRHALETVVGALEASGAGRDDVVRTRMYVTDTDDWEAVTGVHAEFFADVRPASTLVEGSGLVGAEYVVEVEAEAVVPDDP